MRHTLLDKNRIEVLHIRQADKFIDSGVVAYVPSEVGIGLAPLFCRYTEHCHIQHIGFIGVDDACLCRCNLRGNKILLYGIGMYTVVDFRQLTFRRPTQQTLLLRLQPLKFLDDVDFELRANPHRKFKGYILVGVCTTISTGFCLNTYCVCFCYKFLDAYLETIEAGLIPN